MKIGIHHTKDSFSDRWIAFCEENEIDFKLVDCYSSDIVQQLADCEILMWHFNHKDSKDSKFAKQLLFSLQNAGKRVFPDVDTVWHFDDKVGQKYLLESIDAPLAPAYVFYKKQEALLWAASTSYPKVFKLRNGAGSQNVRLVKSEAHARKLIRKAFGRGFKQYEAWSNLQERIRKYRHGKTTLWDVFKGMIRLVRPTRYARFTGREVGYIYFQEFIPENDHDIRVIVVGDKAFAIKRLIRENDFRASGSGFVLYEKEHFNDEVIRLSFDLSEKLHSQCMTYDYVFQDGKALLVEISYGFVVKVYDDCVGFWNRDLSWNEGHFNPYGWMVEDIIK